MIYFTILYTKVYEYVFKGYKFPYTTLIVWYVDLAAPNQSIKLRLIFKWFKNLNLYQVCILLR